MGPLPKRRHSTGRGGRRYKNITQKTQMLIKCPNCGALKLSHRVCPKCKTYAATQKPRANSQSTTAKH